MAKTISISIETRGGDRLADALKELGLAMEGFQYRQKTLDSIGAWKPYGLFVDFRQGGKRLGGIGRN